jgi:hypothetical protein
MRPGLTVLVSDLLSNFRKMTKFRRRKSEIVVTCQTTENDRNLSTGLRPFFCAR